MSFNVLRWLLQHLSGMKTRSLRKRHAFQKTAAVFVCFNYIWVLERSSQWVMVIKQQLYIYLQTIVMKETCSFFKKMKTQQLNKNSKMTKHDTMSFYMLLFINILCNSKPRNKKSNEREAIVGFIMCRTCYLNSATSLKHTDTKTHTHTHKRQLNRAYHSGFPFKHTQAK